MGLPTAVFLLVGVAETLAGLGAIVGGIPSAPRRDLVTRLAGLAALPVMLGAIAMVHWPQWSFVANEAKPMGGMEFQVLLACVAAYFLVTGAPATKEQDAAALPGRAPSGGRRRKTVRPVAVSGVSP